jgi:hypothetical protein
MNKKLIGIILSLGIVVVACVASSGCLDWFAGEWDSSYRYWVDIKNSEDIYNTTIQLPIPIKDGIMLFDANDITDKPSDWICEMIDTEHGKMLKISANVITSGYHSLMVRKKTYHEINIDNPTGNEPLLCPRFNVSDNNFQSYIYINYTTASDTNLTIHIDFAGSKNRGILGAIECRWYSDNIEHTISNKVDGWQVVKGYLEIKR